VEARQVLVTVPFFAEVLNAAELDTLAAAARRVDIDRGTSLIRERDPRDSMFVIVSGSVSVSIRDAGTERSVATLRARDIVGEMALLTGAPRAASVTAQAPVVALEIDRSAIEPLLEAEPALFDRFAAMLEKRQTELDELYGPGIWPFYGPRRANLATVIRSYFSGIPKGS
jgi:CRP-like cAMP-binding protein